MTIDEKKVINYQNLYATFSVSNKAKTLRDYSYQLFFFKP